MPHLRQLLCAALTTGLFLTSGPAEARFGKRSSDDDGDSKSDKVHDATAVGQSGGSSSGGGGRSHNSGSSYSDVRSDVDTALSVLSFLVDVAHVASEVHAANETTYYPPPPPPVAVQQEVVEQRQPRETRSRNLMLFRTGVEGQALGGGAAMALNLGLEGLHWGVGGAMTSMKLPTDDGTAGTDKLELYSVHLTYALLTGDEGRLRAEAGVAGARAPDVALVGPSIALSFERCLFGAMDLEGRAQLVPVPYMQLDAQAGLGLHMGILTLRGGWRWMLLNDRGLAGGDANQDVLSGPYVGLGLNI
ncbi:hypothetical protein JRI60_04125 [Archangium violaceum]|uniref:hypothetical protein n=1 Tax=Archangium violaceum TaxID=83451 RepID=UPI0019510B6B|nr:hypothetical protein [Archangium violaceum]QRN98265.1 hypothetical protein JRI60_04125 [Archangium violaceum]